MVALGPEYLLPGHGLPVAGADRVRQALTDTAELLESLVSRARSRRTGSRPTRRWRACPAGKENCE
jgi:hypothetical protein